MFLCQQGFYTKVTMKTIWYIGKCHYWQGEIECEDVDGCFLCPTCATHENPNPDCIECHGIGLVLCPKCHGYLYIPKRLTGFALLAPSMFAPLYHSKKSANHAIRQETN